MIELAVILLRLVQYSAASVLMGSALFFVYALPARGPASAASLRWAKPLLIGAALMLAAGTLLGLALQTEMLADELSAEALTAVVTQMDLGKAAVARAALALIAAICAMVVPRGRTLWLGTGVLGSLACATFGWMGHGAATEGGGHTLHLVADVLHALAAAGWIGALVAFAALAAPPGQEPERLSALSAALQRFSPVGISLVAALAATGLVNVWYLIGTDVAAVLRDPYAQLLALKLVLFTAMLALAALHRQRSVPALAATLETNLLPQGDVLASLRRSLFGEAALGLAVLAAVAWLGTLAPPA
uniref:copper homeostasis membrane protein CopD n=1 Tax=Altererythrobacter segetis TaxID=1104773 RepID=UPI00140C691A|nr:copper homeostasis membrane protein CopD [Altererythrobacter segetis]